MHEIILADFKFGDFPQNHQFTKISRYMVLLIFANHFVSISLAKLTAEVTVGKRHSELNLLKKPCLVRALQRGVGGAASNT